ncbi:hypothetical protein [Galactobacter sp.]|uniref:hypothetical protein n=1 Tax=Galactobacter sp. TaxID=2676125 RepID=UPI0025C53E97|nr:hypothetical protein [Galactobacter sp.]
MTTCTNTQACQQETAPGMYLCRDCVRCLSRLIGEAETLLTLAPDVIAKQGCNRSAGGSTAAVSSAPINLDALTWRDALARVLRVNHLDDQRQDPDRRAWQAARSGNAGYVIADLQDKVWRLRRLVDLPVERRRLAACGVEGCAGSYLYVQGATVATCQACKATMDVREYREWQLTQATGTPLPLAKLCRVLAKAGVGVKPATARKWVQRGRLEPDSVDGKGRALYTANQVLNLAAVPA